MQRRQDRKLHVYVLSEVFYPETTSTGFYLTAIADRLAQNGPVEALCARPATGATPPKVEDHHNVRIVRVGRMSASSASIAQRAVGAIGRALRIFSRLLRCLHQGDSVIAVTNPPILPPLAALVCLIRRARFILLVHDVYPEAAVVAGLLDGNSMGCRIWRRLQGWVYHRAERIICLGRDAKALIATVAPETTEKLVVIPNWAETDTVRVLAKGDSNFAVMQRVIQRFVVLYVGNLGRTHDSGVISEAARRLETQPDIMFLLAAVGSRFAEFATAAEREARANLVAVPLPEARDQQSDTLAAGDVVLITFKPGMGGVSVPSRMYNAMAAGKPLIAVADPDSELALVIREEAIGWVVPPGDAAALERAVLEAYANPERLREMGKRARAAALTKYSPGTILAQYQSLFTSLTSASSQS